jgi:SlyX protein
LLHDILLSGVLGIVGRMSDPNDERFMDVDVKLAFQERLIHELDTLVRGFGERLDKAERELRELKQSIAPPVPIGPANEPPPHY